MIDSTWQNAARESWCVERGLACNFLSVFLILLVMTGLAPVRQNTLLSKGAP